MGIFFLDYYVLLCNTCLYRSVHRHGHRCHSSPLAEVRIPCRAAARAHFLVINKGASLQSQYLFPELETTYSRKAVEDALQYIKMYVGGF